MHELSIAYSIVETVSEAAQNADAAKVNKIFLKIGKLSGVVKDALLFSFVIGAQGSFVEGATLEIEELPVIVHCQNCDKNVELESVYIFRCPDCNELTPEIIQGKEMEIVSLEIEDKAKHESANT
jgi:hydrogenase nickel incorporation protein HypA/HybF